ncbi:MAG: VWA domain-containing protein [Thermoanaerobaculia bacterium]
MKIRAFLLSLALVVPAAFAQEPFREKVDVDLVLVDVTVTDSRGNQILGLAKDDFIVREDGALQEIASVDYFTNRTLLTAREEDAPFQVDRVRQERYFVLFFHEFADPTAVPGYMGDLMRAKRAAIEFVQNELQPQDLVAIAGYDVRLKVYADFTTDPKILRRALNDMSGFSRGLRKVPEYAGEVSILRNLDTREMMNDTGRIYDALRLLGDALRPIPARKVMALVSPGIGEPNEMIEQIVDNEEMWYRPMIQSLNAANVSVHAMTLLRDVVHFAPEQTLSRIASETGGEYFKNFASFETPLDRIEEASSGYYLLTYRIRKPEGEHGYQKIDVSLRNPEFRIRAREGYAY